MGLLLILIRNLMKFGIKGDVDRNYSITFEDSQENVSKDEISFLGLQLDAK